MKKRIRILGVAALVFALVFLPAGISASAEQDEQAATDRVGFFVRPLLPKNQREGDHGYFDLRVQPGQAQELAVEVFNQTDHEMIIEVRAVSASSGRFGVIDYTTPDVRDQCMFCAFCDIAEIRENTLTVPPLGSVKAVVAISMPQETYDGVVLGGLVFTRALVQPDDSDSSGATLGATIQNRYSYVVGVVLNETDTPVEPDFEVHTVQPEVVSHHVSPVHYIRNTNAAIAKGMSLSIQVFREGALFMAVEQDDLDMAPNSVMPFAPTAPEDHLPAGHYISKIELRLDGRVWRFEKSFTITGAQARELSGVSAQPSGLPLWVIVLIAVLALAVAALVFAVVYQHRAQSRRNREKPGQPYKKT